MEDPLTNPGIYSIHVIGKLDATWVNHLWGMKIVHMRQREYNYSTVTIILGSLPDQAALCGVINTLYNCRYPLLLIRYIRSD